MGLGSGKIPSHSAFVASDDVLKCYSRMQCQEEKLTWHDGSPYTNGRDVWGPLLKFDGESEATRLKNRNGTLEVNDAPYDSFEYEKINFHALCEMECEGK